jgi:hypothetical protein
VLPIALGVVAGVVIAATILFVLSENFDMNLADF